MTIKEDTTIAKCSENPKILYILHLYKLDTFLKFHITIPTVRNIEKRERTQEQQNE